MNLARIACLSLLLAAPFVASTASADPTPPGPLSPSVDAEAARAPAPPPALPAPAAVKPARVWYGWQTLTSDATGLLLGIGGASTHTDALAAGGILVLGLGAPIVHAAHGRWGAAAGSLLMRVGGVVGGFAIAYALTPVDHNSILGGLPAMGNGIAGAGLGLAAASALDAALLAYEDGPSTPPTKDQQARAPRPRATPITPTVGLVRGGAMVGVGGAL